MKIYASIKNRDILTPFWFSNWIVLWFLLFMCGMLPYNPSFILVIVVITISIIIIHDCIDDMVNKKTIEAKKEFHKFCIICIITKMIPLYILIITCNLATSYKDVYFGFGLFALYNIFLFYNNTNFLTYYNIIK